MAVYAKNKRAFHDYQILDDVEAGIVLTGAEVKSVREGGANLVQGFIRFENGEAWLYGASIRAWKTSSDKTYDQFRKRKLLLKNKEIFKYSKKIEQKGIAMVPLEIYSSKKRIKVKLGIAKGKKATDRDADKARREQKIKDKREFKKILTPL